MATATIRSYFETKLKTWADAQSPALQVSFENVPFTKPTSTTFIECFLLPSLTLNPSVKGTSKRELGIFQVNVWAPSGKGTLAAITVAQGIVDLFPIVPKEAVSIEQTPSIEKGILDSSGWYVIPVSIPYRLES